MNPFQDCFQKADDEWSAELKRLFGKRAGDVRYTKEGEGAAGSRLRALYEEFKIAQRDWAKWNDEQRKVAR